MSGAQNRSDRHEQTILMREQIIAYHEVLAGMEPDGVGSALAVNMVGGFALELSLKLFYMSLKDEGPDRGHSLCKFWLGLPDEFREEIDREYQKDPRSKAEYPIFGLQRSAVQPRPEDKVFHWTGTADSFFKMTDKNFVEARYFYEEVSVGQWKYFAAPKEPMLAMLDVLLAFYQSFARS